MEPDYLEAANLPLVANVHEAFIFEGTLIE